MTDEEDRNALIEEAATAWRPSSEKGPSTHPAWEELDDEGRIEAFDISESLRQMEAALDPKGLSTTAKAVMERVAGQQEASEAEPERAGKLIAFPRRIMQSQPLAMAAVAMLVIGIGVWVGRDDRAPDVDPAGEERLAAVEESARERAGEAVESEAVAEAETADPPDQKVAAVQSKRPRRKRAATPPGDESAQTEEPRDEVPALAAKEPTEPTPERPALEASVKRSPTDTGSAKALSGSEQQGAVTEQERKICRARVSVVEKMLSSDENYDPVPEEQLALGRCYDLLENKTKAREWLRRASKHPETKSRAEKALRQLRRQ